MRLLRVVLLSAFILLGAGPAGAASGLDTTLTLSDVRPGSKGVTYSWDLAVLTDLEARAIRVSVADGTTGTPNLYLVDGLPGGTMGFDGRTIDYRFERPVLLPAGTQIIFAVSGLTNPAMARGFTSQVRLGDVGASTQPLEFDAAAGTRAMVFITSEAARLSRDDPAIPRSKVPVLMTNEQHLSHRPMPQLTSPWFAKVPAVGLVALPIALALWLFARRTFQVA